MGCIYLADDLRLEGRQCAVKEVEHDHSPTECPVCGTCQPELIFDILEKTDDQGDRVHSSEFWQKRYKEQQDHATGEIAGKLVARR